MISQLKKGDGGKFDPGNRDLPIGNVSDDGEDVLDAYWQYEIPLWLVVFLFLVMLLVPMEVGFRLGTLQRRLHPDAGKAARTDVTLTSMLALLGLMLAFTYSFTMGRADMRKQALITEVNAISSAFLRADLAAEPSRTELRELLFDYARSRLVTPGKIETREQLQEVVDRSLEIQSKIWPATMSALQQDGNMSGPEKALLVSGVNDVLDAHTSRMAVIYDRLPTAVLALLVLVAAVSLAVTAYNTSLNGQQSRWRMTAFAVILASLMYIILDFDMIMRGFIRINYDSLVSLIQEMEASLNCTDRTDCRTAPEQRHRRTADKPGILSRGRGLLRRPAAFINAIHFGIPTDHPIKKPYGWSIAKRFVIGRGARLRSIGYVTNGTSLSKERRWFYQPQRS